MGRNLFVRVSVVTYDEKAVLRDWPKLSALAWPDDTTGKGRLSVFAKERPRGVLDLVGTLVEQARFADPPEPSLSAKDADLLESLHKNLEAALAERDVPTAHRLVQEIEDALDAAEADLLF